MKVAVLKSGAKQEVDLDVKIDPSITDYAIGVLARVAKQNLKQGTKYAKGRSEVQGRAAKPFRQKGTGNARQGSRKGPHMRGGGISHGPQIDYKKLTLNGKFKHNVLKKLISKYIEEGNFGFIDLSSDAKDLRKALGSEKALIIFSNENKDKIRGVRNLPKVRLIGENSVSPLNILDYSKVYFDLNTKDKVKELFK